MAKIEPSSAASQDYLSVQLAPADRRLLHTRRSTHFAPPSVARLSRQCQAILEKLKAAGSGGCTGDELYALVRRVGSRIFDLRAAGADILTIREREGQFRYILRELPENLGPLPTPFEQRRRQEEAEAMPLFAAAGVCQP